MRALMLHEYGSPPIFSIEEQPVASLAPGEARLRVHAVGVGFPDALMVAGKYQFKPAVPFIPGTAVAGVVLEVGPQTSTDATRSDSKQDGAGRQEAEKAAVRSTPRPGDRVLVMADSGGLAEECVVDAQTLIRLPETMGMQDAAGFLVNYGTTYHALVQRARLQPGETLLVPGAGGGAGLSAVEIGKALGARVLAGAGSEAKRALASQHGADEVFDYTRESIKDKIREFTQGRGIDVVYDPVGADVAEQAVRSMAWNGRYLVIGFAGGRIPAIPLNLPLLKGCSIVGVFWGEHTRRQPQVHAQNLQALFDMHRQGKIRPRITVLKGLERFGEALDMINGRRVEGKIVIQVNGEDKDNKSEHDHHTFA